MGEGIVIRAAHFPGRAPDRRLRQWRLPLRRHVASRLDPLPAVRHLRLGAGATPRSSTPADFDRVFAEAGQRSRSCWSAPARDLRPLPPQLRAGAAASGHLRRSDVDRRRGAHLQRAAGRGPRRRGRPGRRRLTGTAAAAWTLVRGGRSATATSRRSTPRRPSAPTCSRSTPSTPRSRASATGQRAAARRDPPAMVARRARRERCGERRRPSRGRRRCSRRSDATGCRSPRSQNYLDARIFDLYDDPMPTRNDLEGYSGETASALIQLAAIVLDPRARPRVAELPPAMRGARYAMTGIAARVADPSPPRPVLSCRRTSSRRPEPSPQAFVRRRWRSRRAARRRRHDRTRRASICQAIRARRGGAAGER